MREAPLLEGDRREADAGQAVPAHLGRPAPGERGLRRDDLGPGVTQAAEVAGPLKVFLDSLPYYLDDQKKLAYRSASIAINHTPVLTYKAPHPKAGEVAAALYTDGAYATMRGGAPMPAIDMDMIGPYALEQLLIILNQILATQVSAT